MALKGYWDCPEEIFVGAALQFPLYFIMGWSVIPAALICGVLWRLGGWSKGHKLFRRLGVPIFVCFCAFMCTKNQWVFAAVPFMTWLTPSYGKQSWLYKLLKNDFLTRIITYAWYWAVFSIAYVI